MPLRDIEKIFIKFAEHNIANKLKKSSKLHRLIQTLFANILKWIGNPWQFFKLLKGEQLPALLHNDKSVKPNTLKNNFWYRLLTPPNFFKLVTRIQGKLECLFVSHGTVCLRTQVYTLEQAFALGCFARELKKL